MFSKIHASPQLLLHACTEWSGSRGACTSVVCALRDSTLRIRAAWRRLVAVVAPVVTVRSRRLFTVPAHPAAHTQSGKYLRWSQHAFSSHKYDSLRCDVAVALFVAPAVN